MRLLKLPALQLVALWRLAVTATGDQVVAAGKAEEAEEAARAGANRGEAPRMEAVALLKRDPAGVTSAGAATTPGEGGEFGDLGAGRPLEARSSPRTSSAGVDRRWLGGQGIDGNTIGAHPAAGNPNPSCGSETSCINGCPSVFYRVLGTGANMTASTCPYNDYDSRIYVWEGDACANFKCVVADDNSCLSTPNAASVGWDSEKDVVYHIQVTGLDASSVGQFTLQVISDDLGSVSVSSGCRATPGPTKPPTSAPTTKPPTRPPTAAPATKCPEGTTFWVRDPSTNVPTRRLVNNTATCLAHPYDIEVRPCNGAQLPRSRPIRVRLAAASGGGAIVHKSPKQREPPFLLFGSPASAAAAPALPNGAYAVSVAGANAALGRLAFAQDCPCPKARKGKKGCMQKRT